MKMVLGWFEIDTIISGGAKGADKLAEKYALERGIPVTVHEPDWDLHGRSAGYIRNKLIVQDADEIIAFWDRHSKGTKHTIDIAEKANKPVHIFWSEFDEIAQLGL